jgi:hypothetical protein
MKISDSKEDLSYTTVPTTKQQENPVKLTFQNLNYEVKVPRSKEDLSKSGGPKMINQRIIKDCSGYALPG